MESDSRIDLFESLVNSDRYQTLNRHYQWNLRLRALLIQIGIKLKFLKDWMILGLRALLIQIGIKRKCVRQRSDHSLRALLIQIGIKPSRLFGATDPCLRVLLILYVGNNLQM